MQGRTGVLGFLTALALTACASPDALRLATVEAFRAAREADDLELARTFTVDDPRVWYDAKEGPGDPWTFGGGGGRWSAWDEHFRSSSAYGPWHVEGDIVWADVEEMNDYYLLTERGPGWWRASYFLDPDGRIAGFMVSAVPGRTSERGRRDEFAAWARENDPEEAEYLMPGGSIDPTGDRPPRMRALLVRWRTAVGLPADPSPAAR